MQYCPHCGERVEPGDAYCFECGTKLDAPPEKRDKRPGSADPRDEQATRADRPDDGWPDEHRSRGRDPGGRPRGGDTPTHDHPEQDSTRVASLTTVWVALALSVVTVIENVSTILFAEELLEQAEEFGLAEGLSADFIVAQGVIGLVIALAVAGLCYYYYRQGYVDRRFFWGLIGAGVVGFFFGAGLAAILLALVGGYGLLVVMRRDRPDRPGYAG